MASMISKAAKNALTSASPMTPAVKKPQVKAAKKKAAKLQSKAKQTRKRNTKSTKKIAGGVGGKRPAIPAKAAI